MFSRVYQRVPLVDRLPPWALGLVAAVMLTDADCIWEIPAEILQLKG